MSKTKQCTKCKRILPENNTYYFNNKSNKTGLEPSCKECLGYTFQNLKDKYKTEAGFKICRKCEESLPLNSVYFGKNATVKDGFHSRCRVCMGSQYEIQSKRGFKICRRCKVEKPLNNDNYHKDSSASDKYDSTCKECKFSKNISIFSIDVWYSQRSMKFKNTWDFMDIKWMYENYKYITKTELIDYFNREIGYKTLTNIIYQWNVKKFDKNKPWTTTDIDFLKTNYPSMPQTELEAYYSDRTWDAVKNKASKLNIVRDDDTLKIIRSISQTGVKHSLETRRKQSLSRRGIKNWNWKGGISPIVVRLRDFTVPWKLDSLAEHNYKCILSNINDGTLQVHHLNKNFSEITYEAFESINLEVCSDMTIYTQEERDLLRDKILELHYSYGLGVPLTKELHVKFHSIYGNKNNTPEQFYEFQKRYINGEFNNQLEKVI